MTDDPEDDLIARKAAAGYLGVSQRTLDRWAKDNLLPKIYKGPGRIFFKKRHLDALKRGKPLITPLRDGFKRLCYYVDFPKSGRAVACEPIATSPRDLALHALTPWKVSD